MLTFSLLLFLKGFKVYKQEYPAEAETNEPDIETNKEGDDHQEEWDQWFVATVRYPAIYKGRPLARSSYCSSKSKASCSQQ